MQSRPPSSAKRPQGKRKRSASRAGMGDCRRALYSSSGLASPAWNGGNNGNNKEKPKDSVVPVRSLLRFPPGTAGNAGNPGFLQPVPVVPVVPGPEWQTQGERGEEAAGRNGRTENEDTEPGGEGRGRR